MTDLSLS